MLQSAMYVFLKIDEDRTIFGFKFFRHLRSIVKRVINQYVDNT